MSRTAHILHEDNTGLISKVDEQQQLISKFRKEQERLGAGDAVPQWVVSSLELQLSSTEAHVAALEVERDTLTSQLSKTTSQARQTKMELEAERGGL